MNHCPKRYTIGANIFFLVCNRELDHPGMHRDNAVGLYWHETAPPLEYLELG